MRSLTGFNSSAVQGSFAKGNPIMASDLNKLANAASAAQTMMSNDVTFFAGNNGVSYGLPQEVVQAAILNPLDPVISGDKVTITPGTVNRYIPKIGSNYIDQTPPPTITVTDNGYILVKASYEVNKFFPRTAEIVFLAVATPPADTNTESYYPLAKVVKTISSGVTSYSLTGVGFFNNGNLVVNRLKAGNNTATWWWDVID
jgi:hypothetical protein